MKLSSRLLPVVVSMIAIVCVVPTTALTLRSLDNPFGLPPHLNRTHPSFARLHTFPHTNHSVDELTGESKSIIKHQEVNMNFTKLEQYFEKCHDYNRFWGSFTIYYQNNIWSFQTGPMSPTNRTIPNQHTKYRIGSITKTYTAVLIMQAIERGHLSLDTPLEQFFPYSTYGIKFSDKITIRHLLSHRSGLFNYTSDPQFTLFKQNRTLQEVIEFINKSSSTQKDPDTITQGSYSNSGFYLLGEILSRVYNVPFFTILERELLHPLNLTETSFYSLPELHHPAPFTKKNEVSGYFLNYLSQFQENDQYTDSSCLFSAGAILSNLGDVISYFKQIFIEHKIISKESIALMRHYQPLVEGVNYGLGLFEYPVKNASGFGHNGSIDGFLSQVAIMPIAPGGDPVNGDDYFIIAYSANAYATAQKYVTIPMLATVYNVSWEVPNFDEEDNQHNYKEFSGLWIADSNPNVNFTIFTITHITPPIHNHPKTLALLTPGLKFPLPVTYYDQPEMYVVLRLNVVIQFDRTKKKAILFQNNTQIPFSKQQHTKDRGTMPHETQYLQPKRLLHKFKKE